MCEITKKYKLCTCENMADKSNLNTWTLTRLIGMRPSTLVGKMLQPIEDFENGISSEALVAQLNSENCFDFDYTPSENDSLIISMNTQNKYKYFPLIYRNGEWQRGRNPAFRSITETIAEGQIELLEK